MNDDERQSLAQTLTNHHQLVDGWAYLADDINKVAYTQNNFDRLRKEFIKAREAIIHYEYTVQRLLGINPSPLAEPEEEKPVSVPGHEHMFSIVGSQTAVFRYCPDCGVTWIFRYDNGMTDTWIRIKDPWGEKE